MVSVIEKRIAALESRTSSASRRVHVIKATSVVDRDQQVSELIASGMVGPGDGFLCLMGRPLLH